MMHNNDSFFDLAGMWAPLFIALFVFLLIWEGIWKAFALWHSARNGHTAWFICIIVFNTIGILPITYLLLHRRKQR